MTISLLLLMVTHKCTHAVEKSDGPPASPTHRARGGHTDPVPGSVRTPCEDTMNRETHLEWHKLLQEVSRRGAKSAGGSPDKTDPATWVLEDNFTLLHIAAGDDLSQVLRWMLAHGGDPNTPIDTKPLRDGMSWSCDASGDTPLHFTIQKGSKQCAIHLLSAGADPTVRNKNGFTPAAWAKLCARPGGCGDTNRKELATILDLYTSRKDQIYQDEASGEKPAEMKGETQQLIPFAIDFAQKGIDADGKQDFELAYTNYLKSAEFFEMAIKHEMLKLNGDNGGELVVLLKKREEILARAEQIRQFPDAEQESSKEQEMATKKDRIRKGLQLEQRNGLEKAIEKQKKCLQKAREFLQMKQRQADEWTKRSIEDPLTPRLEKTAQAVRDGEGGADVLLSLLEFTQQQRTLDTHQSQVDIAQAQTMITTIEGVIRRSEAELKVLHQEDE